MDTAVEKTPFHQDIEFHLFQHHLEKLDKKILSMKMETPDSYIQQKLTVLGNIKSVCDTLVHEYNENFLKYPNTIENLKLHRHIFYAGFFYFITNFNAEKEGLEVLCKHRSTSGSIYSQLPSWSGVLTGVAAGLMLGPLAGIGAGLVSMKAVNDITGLKGRSPDSAKIFFDLLLSLLAKADVHSLEELKAKAPDNKPELHWLKENDPIPAEPRSFILYLRNSNSIIECYKDQKWIALNGFLNPNELLLLKKHEVANSSSHALFSKPIDLKQYLFIFPIANKAVAYRSLEESLPPEILRKETECSFSAPSVSNDFGRIG